jgi:hypothetical protein
LLVEETLLIVQIFAAIGFVLESSLFPTMPFWNKKRGRHRLEWHPNNQNDFLSGFKFEFLQINLLASYFMFCMTLFPGGSSSLLLEDVVEKEKLSVRIAHYSMLTLFIVAHFSQIVRHIA